jgi:hypothetical protein
MKGGEGPGGAWARLNAMRFLQVENQMERLMDLLLSAQLPVEGPSVISAAQTDGLVPSFIAARRYPRLASL